MKEFRFVDLSIGQRAEFSITITAEMVTVFAQLSGDMNPLHTDAGYAASRGHRSQVAHGLLTASLLSALVGMHLPGKLALLHGVSVSFHAPVYVGDELCVAGEITHLGEAYRRVELRTRVTNQDGTLVAKGKVQVGVDE